MFDSGYVEMIVGLQTAEIGKLLKYLSEREPAELFSVMYEKREIFFRNRAQWDKNKPIENDVAALVWAIRDYRTMTQFRDGKTITVEQLQTRYEKRLKKFKEAKLARPGKKTASVMAHYHDIEQLITEGLTWADICRWSVKYWQLKISPTHLRLTYNKIRVLKGR